jgi:hypothetical protein
VKVKPFRYPFQELLIQSISNDMDAVLDCLESNLSKHKPPVGREGVGASIGRPYLNVGKIF